MKLRKTPLALLLALCATLVASASPASAGTKAPRIDVSRFQGTIDWPTVAASGIRFAFVQAARGNGTGLCREAQPIRRRSFYAVNYANAKAAGIRVGPYHPPATGATRAEARRRDLRGRRLPRHGRHPTPATCCRARRRSPSTKAHGQPPAHLGAGWLKRVRARLGVKPMIYPTPPAGGLPAIPASSARPAIRSGSPSGASASRASRRGTGPAAATQSGGTTARGWCRGRSRRRARTASRR